MAWLLAHFISPREKETQHMNRTDREISERLGPTEVLSCSDLRTNNGNAGHKIDWFDALVINGSGEVSGGSLPALGFSRAHVSFFAMPRRLFLWKKVNTETPFNP